MSEALMTDPTASLSDAAFGVPKLPGRATAKHHVIGPVPIIEDWTPPAVRPMTLPTVQPGELWLIELPPEEPKFAPLEYRALTTANVLIYDRRLAQTVARLLSLGGYAEPAPTSDGVSDRGSERCIRFALDGWSVARLIDPYARPGGLANRERVDKIRQLSKRALSTRRLADLPVLIFANTGCGAYERSEAALHELIDPPSFEEARTLTIVFRGFGNRGGPHLDVASANRLAG